MSLNKNQSERRIKLVALNGESVAAVPSAEVLSGRVQSQLGSAPTLPSSSRVLKAGDLKNPQSPKSHTVSPYSPTSLSSTLPASVSESTSLDPVSSLKENLKTLNELHLRLRFMLKEIETIIDE